MNTNDLNTALYEKMAAEQDKYRDWLKSQPPEEILHHTYEYTVREDIVMAMEQLELTDAQAQALLDSPTPLADVYRYFENWAKTIPMPEDSGASRHCAYLVVDGVNPGLTDLFTRQARKTMQEQQKSSVLQKLKQEPPAHKPAAPKKQEPER